MPSILSPEMKQQVKGALKKLMDAIAAKREEFQNTKDVKARASIKDQLVELRAKYNKFHAQLNGTSYTSMAKGKPLVAESAANAYLMLDGLANFDKIKALNVKTSKYQPDKAAGIAITGVYTIPRRAKPTKHSAAKHKAVDIKYLGQRAIKVSLKKRMTPAGAIRNIPLLTVVEGAGVPAALKAQIKQAQAALNSHMKKTDSVKTKVAAKRTKLRSEADKEFDKALTAFRAILTTAGVKPTDLIESKGMMGRTVLLKVGGLSVVSIGRSDMTRFKAAVKASKAA